MIDTSMYQGGSLANPAGAFLQGVQLARQMRDQDELRQRQNAEAGALTEQRRSLAAERENTIATRQAEAAQEQRLRQLFSDPTQITPGAVYSIVGPVKGAEILKGMAALDEQHAKTFQTTQGVIGAVLGGIKALPEGLRPDGYSAARQNLLQRGLITPEDAPEQYDPGFLDQIERSLMNPEQRYNAENPTLIQRDPTKDLVSPKTGEVVQAATPPPEKTYPVTVPGPNGPVRVLKTESELKAGVPEYRAPQAAAQATPNGGLSGDGLELAATRYRLTGQLPARDSAQNAAILSKAAEQGKLLGKSPAAVVQQQFATKADSSALNQARKMQTSAQAFESKALGQVEIIKELSAKVKRSSYPLINAALQAGRTEIAGDSNATQLANAVETFTEEYAKIMNGSTGGAAAASDSSRAASKRLINTAMSKGTMADVLALMQREMSLTMSGYDETIRTITDRMNTGGAAPVEPAPRTGAAPGLPSYQDYLKSRGGK